jgi:choice-of-anchor B domain-containing protein
MNCWQKTFLTLTLVAAPSLTALALPRDWPGTVPDQQLIGEVESLIGVDRSAASSTLEAQAGKPDLEAVWVGSPRWMNGINWGGRTFFNSLDFGSDFFGSSLQDEDYVPVVIEFSADSITLCQTFRRDLGYASAGVGQFPGMAWDMSNPGTPRRLNICFVEDNSLGIANLAWDPSSTSVGKREYVFVMDSDYDGTGLTYAGQNIYSGAGSMDVQFAWWPLVEPGQVLLGSLPASLEITPYYVRNLRALPSSGSLTLTWSYSAAVADRFRVFSGTTNPPTSVDSVNGSVFSLEQSGLTDGVTYYYRVEAVDNGGITLATSTVLSAVPQVVSSNVDLVGVWNERGTYGDCWGYVDTTTGTEYALICARNEGVSIIDIDQNPPVEVGFMPGIVPGNDTKDVKLYKHYAIVIAENEPAQIFDIVNPAAPMQVATISMPGGAGAHNCLIEGDYLYVIGDHNIGGLLIFDISNPALPDSVGSFAPFYYHDIDIRNDTVCATGIYGDGIDLLNVANKTSPSLVTRFNYAGSGAHNAEYSSDGNYVFIGDEIGSSGNWTRVFDISNPASVTLVSEMIVDPQAAVHNCYLIHDTLLIIGHYTEGVRVWNVADPVNPFEVGYYDTYLPAVHGYAGCWSVFPYFPSGRVIASDMQTGLYVLSSDLLATPTSCCVGLTGNANGDPLDEVTLTDLTVLVNYLFVTFQPLPCPEEANTSGDPQGDLTLTDLTVLVNNLFVTFQPLPACQ